MTFYFEKDEEVPAENQLKRGIEIVAIEEKSERLIVKYESNFIGAWDGKVVLDSFYDTSLGRKVHWKDCNAAELDSLLAKTEPYFPPESLERECFIRELAKHTNFPLFSGEMLEVSIVSGTFCVREVQPS